MPSLLVLMPLIVLVVFNFPLGKRFKASFFWVALCLFALDIVIIAVKIPLLGLALSGIDAFFRIEYSTNAPGIIVLLCIAVIAVSSLLVAKNSSLDAGELNNFINLVMVASIGMSGIVLAKDVFTLYIYIEVTSITSFILVALKKDLDALDGSFKYILLSAVASIFMLIGISILFLLAKSTSYTAIAQVIGEASDRSLVTAAVFFFTAGLLIKGGLVPFHGWVPDAYSYSSSPVSVFLAGIVTKVCGAFPLIRLYGDVFGFYDALKIVLLVIGSLSIVLAAFAALGQSKYKRMFAFSSISQVGFIIVGLGTGTQLGVIGAIFHLMSHAMFKSLLFVNASAIELKTGECDMANLGGLGKKMPVTSVTSVIASLSAAGIPPLAGFWSKLIIIIALWNAGYYAIAIIAVCASIVTLGYLLLFQRKVFFGKPREGLEYIKEAPVSIIVASLILAFLCIAAGILFPLILEMYGMPLADIL